MWRLDGQPIWQDAKWIADEKRDYGFTFKHARLFSEALSENLGVDSKWLVPAYEDVHYYLWREQRLPLNVKPWDPKLEDPEERTRMARVFSRGINKPVGVVLPIQRQWWQSRLKWRSGPWPVRPEKLFLLPGDSAIGLRLPLDTLPYSRGSTGAIPHPDRSVFTTSTLVTRCFHRSTKSPPNCRANPSQQDWLGLARGIGSR
jgi:uncharacterized protein (DUF2126 family)